MGKGTYLDVPTHPTTVAGGKAGYHAAAVTEDSHCLFEEVLSLGVAGDMLMAVATDAQEPAPVFGLTFPDRATASDNLLGKFSPIGTRRPEIAQRLAGYGITGVSFQEYCVNTRFNRQYFRSMS